jgi:N-acylneuraminate cytidylyltransferase
MIPARGGSKRIPRKNIKVFCGQPIIAYPIKAALDAQIFDKVIVSTDDAEIAELSKNLGAEVPFMRPPELSDDYATTHQVINHTLTWLSQNSVRPKTLCCIYPAAPFVTSNMLKNAHEKLIESNHDYVFPVVEFESAVQRALKINPNNSLEPVFPEYQNTRTQDLQAFYHDAGQFYFGKSTAFLANLSIFSNASPIIMSRNHVQDIDNPEDWDRAELLFKTIKRG